MARVPPETAPGLGFGGFSTHGPSKIDIRDVECGIRGVETEPLMRCESGTHVKGNKKAISICLKNKMLADS